MSRVQFAFVVVFSFFSFLVNGQGLSIQSSSSPNSSCDCVYSGKKLLLNQVSMGPIYGNGSIYGTLYADATNVRQGEWIELYNPNPCSAVDISKLILGSVNDGIPSSFIIPEGTIVPPLGFAVVRGLNSPVPPPELIDILISTSENICWQYPGTFNYWLPDFGGWIALYDSDGSPLDAISWGYNTNYLSYSPCLPPGNSVPAGTELASYNSLMSQGIMTNFDLFYPIEGKTPFRIPDGENWAQEYLTEGPELTYGSCNNANQCIEPSPICNGTASVVVSGGITPYTYLWNDANQQTTEMAIGLCEGEYCCTITDALGISQQICVQVTDTTFSINATVIHTTCNQDNGSIDLNPNGTGSYIYTWQPNVSATANADLLAAGTYSIHIAAGNCQRDTTIEIESSLGVSMSLDTISVNCITNTGTATILPLGGTAPFSILWSTMETTSTIEVEQETEYSVIVTDDSGCEISDTFQLASPIFPTVTAWTNSSICEGDIFQLNADGAIDNSYHWTGPNLFESNFQSPQVENATAFMSGMYYVTTINNDCENKDSVFVQIHQNPIIEITADVMSGCSPLQVLLDYTSTIPLTNVSWDFGDSQQLVGSTSGAISHTFGESSTYTISLIGETAEGCVGTIQNPDMIQAFPVAEASFSVNHTTAEVSDPTFEFTNHSLNSSSYIWDFGDEKTDQSTNSTHTYLPVPNDYIVVLVANNQYNCSDSMQMIISILEPLIFYIPNSFTPDNDQFNQMFQPVFTSGFDPNNYLFTIYNRWGEEVFTTENPTKGWDGTYRGFNAIEGTYSWIVTFKDIDTDLMYQQTGHVNLLR